MRKLCVFCGSGVGASPAYAKAARELGELFAQRGIGLVYGGAKVGLMGIVADAVLQNGGEAFGVIPSWLGERELEHRGLTALHRVDSMHERKAKMAELADGFIALPGGCGTMDELFEIWTWALLGLHQKPLGLINVDGYYQHLLAFIDTMVDSGFLKTAYREMLRVATNAETLLADFAAYVPPTKKWSAS